MNHLKEVFSNVENDLNLSIDDVSVQQYKDTRRKLNEKTSKNCKISKFDKEYLMAIRSQLSSALNFFGIDGFNFSNFS